MESERELAEALLRGRMRLVSREEDGAGGAILGFEACEARLTRREQELLRAAESGVANKFVALEHSLSCSTVSESVHTAMTKLGFAKRAEFLKVMASLRSGDPGSAARLLCDTTTCWLVLPLESLNLDPRLTQAERQVVAGVLSGRTNAAIAKARRTSSRTVANQLACIYRKLGVASRWELAARSASLGRCVATGA
ncbi:MAG TPA: LuxR C-terminal-related transcriptional regulator [Polyangiaceae bacterium]|nr:LuxR C-terminal-related transcriptional regulator [Polyangiaceae bacterium]